MGAGAGTFPDPAGELVLESARQPPGVWREFPGRSPLAAAWWTMMKLSAGSSVMALALAVCLLSLGQPEPTGARPGWKPATSRPASRASWLVLGLGILLGSGGVLQPVLALLGLSWDVYAPGGLMLAFLAFQVPLAVLLLIAGPVQAPGQRKAGGLRPAGRQPQPLLVARGAVNFAPSLLQAAFLLILMANAAHRMPALRPGRHGRQRGAVRMTTVVRRHLLPA